MHDKKKCAGEWDSTIDIIKRSLFGWYMTGESLDENIYINYCPFCGQQLEDGISEENKLKPGQTIEGYLKHNERVERIIVSVDKRGYEWKYADNDTLYHSSNSNDPFFEIGWKIKEEDSPRTD